jgi:hypothetical protein
MLRLDLVIGLWAALGIALFLANCGWWLRKRHRERKRAEMKRYIERIYQ